MTTDMDIWPMSELCAETDTSGHTSDRMSAHRPHRIEVITGVERRRRWSFEQKRAIVMESQLPHASPAAIARKHGIGTGQLYTWRRQLLSSRLAGAACFARVELAGEPPRLANPANGSTGMIEIALPGGASVRVDANIDEAALRRVLAAVRG
jgi:transposase